MFHLFLIKCYVLLNSVWKPQPRWKLVSSCCLCKFYNVDWQRIRFVFHKKQHTILVSASMFFESNGCFGKFKELKFYTLKVFYAGALPIYQFTFAIFFNVSIPLMFLQNKNNVYLVKITWYICSRENVTLQSNFRYLCTDHE